MTPDQQITAAVQANVSIAGVLRTLGRAYVGTNYRWLRNEVRRLGLNTSHWLGKAHGTSRGCPSKKTPAQVFVADSPESRGLAKKMLRRLGLIPYRCSICDCSPEWMGRALVLRLDHKNGTRDDHRLENLRFLCPNCDSQTDTFCGRNKRRKKVCRTCGAPSSSHHLRCRSCAQKSRGPHPKKIAWPTPDDLRAQVQASSMRAVAHQLGVSDTAVKKHLRYHP